MSYNAGFIEGEKMCRLEIPIWENWDNEKLYKKGDKVYYNETLSSYVCIKDIKEIGVLIDNIEYWQIIAGGSDWSNLTNKIVVDALGYAPSSIDELINLAGEGRTTETVKDNADNLTAHKADYAKYINKPKIRLNFLAQLSAPDNVEFIIPFGATIDANKINHDDVIDNTKAVITEDGEYLIIGQLNLASNNTGYRRLNIRKNGVITSNTSMNGVTGDFTRIQITTVMKLVTGDYIELSLQQNRGGALDIYVGAAVRPPLTIIKVG